MSNNKLQYKFYYKRNLPHYEAFNGYIFITYRLAFNMPQKILDKLSIEKQRLDALIERLPVHEQSIAKYNCNKILFRIEDEYLPKCIETPQWLKDGTVASMVIDSLLYNHNKKYELFCVLVMSNHVHTILKPLMKAEILPYSISEIMQNHKGYVAHEANKLLNRNGAFWHHESYDHYVRDANEFNRIVWYILNNPVKAGLTQNFKDWKYYWVNGEYIPL